MLTGTMAVVVLLGIALWIPTVTHRTRASGCYTEFGRLQGGGLPTCSHTEADIRTYPNGRRYALYGAVAIALLTLAALPRGGGSLPSSQ